MREGWAFDLDGTLVDTYRATIEAYRRAGVVMPPDAWGRPWTEWCGVDDHNRKGQHYFDCLLELLDVPNRELLRFVNANHWPILTGASCYSVLLIGKVLHIKDEPWLDRVVLREATTIDKIAWLKLRPAGTYVDDNERVRRAIQECTSWRVLDPETALAELQRSSSLPVRTPG